MDTGLTLPYFRDPNELPAPLPTVEAIRSATTVLQGHEEWSTQKIVVLGQHFLVKYGARTKVEEGENLLFVEKHLLIPAPRLYAMWRDEDVVYIVMELIQGVTLESLWSTLDDHDKIHILDKLRPIFAKMRSLPHPGFYGSIRKGPLPSHLFWVPENDPEITGPFEDESEILAALVKRSRLNWSMNKKHSYKADFFQQEFAQALKNHPPTFTHADVQRKNIIVRKVPNEGGEVVRGEGTYEVFIVDWEDAGWYPSYWEYCSASFAFDFSDDWPCWVGSLLGMNWGSEAAMLKMIWQDLYF